LTIHLIGSVYECTIELTSFLVRRPTTRRSHHFRLAEVGAPSPVAQSSCADCEVNTEINVPNRSVANTLEGRQKDGNAAVDGISRALVRRLPLPVYKCAYNENRRRRKRRPEWDFLTRCTFSRQRDFVLDINQSAMRN